MYILKNFLKKVTKSKESRILEQTREFADKKRYLYYIYIYTPISSKLFNPFNLFRLELKRRRDWSGEDEFVFNCMKKGFPK